MKTLSEKEAYMTGYKKGFEDAVNSKPTKKLFLTDGEPVLSFVCDAVNEPIEVIKSASRKKEHVTARKLYSYLCDKYTTLSLKAIGLTIGGRDHTTVIHLLNEVNNAIETDDNLKWLLLEVEKMFLGIKATIPQPKKRMRVKMVKRMRRVLNPKKDKEQKEVPVVKIEPLVRAKADHTNINGLDFYEQKYNHISG
jgi:hypothetical protein